MTKNYFPHKSIPERPTHETKTKMRNIAVDIQYVLQLLLQIPQINFHGIYKYKLSNQTKTRQLKRILPNIKHASRVEHLLML